MTKSLLLRSDPSFSGRSIHPSIHPSINPSIDRSIDLHEYTDSELDLAHAVLVNDLDRKLGLGDEEALGEDPDHGLGQLQSAGVQGWGSGWG